MTSGVPRTDFSADRYWPRSVFIVTKHYFGLAATDGDLELSSEHRAVEWATYDRAAEMLTYHDDRTALWELDARLREAARQGTTALA